MAHRAGNGARKVANGRGNGASWGVALTVAAGVVVALLQAFWAVAYGGVNQRLNTIETEFLRIREYNESVRRLEQQLKFQEERIGGLSPRLEVDARLVTNSTAIQNLRVEVDNFKRDFGQTYSIKDAIAAVQTRIERLETWSKPVSTSVVPRSQ